MSVLHLMYRAIHYLSPIANFLAALNILAGSMITLSNYHIPYYARTALRMAIAQVAGLSCEFFLDLHGQNIKPIGSLLRLNIDYFLYPNIKTHNP